MRSQNEFDVIIVGAGPAGSMLGFELASRSISCCIIEKESLPRYKPCGGGLQHKAASLLPFDISEIVEDTTFTIAFAHNFGDEYEKTYDKPLIYMVQRDKFDNFLTQKALSAGAALAEGESVTDISFGPSYVSVNTDTDNIFTGKIIVGADGARSIVAKKLNLGKDFLVDVGIESELLVSPSKLASFKGKAKIDWGTIPGGYCWIFPKADVLSVGIGAPPQMGKSFNIFFKQWLEYNDLSESDTSQQKGHVLKFRTNLQSPISADRAILLGDAAGLIDRLSGEGLFYAIKSAQIAAPIIQEVLTTSNYDLIHKYDVEINRELMTELKAAENLLKLFNFVPGGIHKFLKKDRPWNAVARILRGEKTYASLEAELGKFQFILEPMHWITGYAFNNKLKKMKEAKYFDNSLK